MHGYFLRPGDVNLPITFSVDRIHDGRSFSTRRTQAYQDGVPILSMIASFQDGDSGLDHQIEMPDDMPEPESLPTTAEVLAHVDHDAARYWSAERAFDMRHVPSLDLPQGRGEHTRAPGRVDEGRRAASRRPEPAPCRAGVRQRLLDSRARDARHGVAWAKPGLKIASLDHAMWWHRFGRVDEWMLYVQDSPSAARRARSLSRQHLLAQRRAAGIRGSRGHDPGAGKRLAGHSNQGLVSFSRDPSLDEEGAHERGE